jgi:hypothetical protein
MEQRTMTRFFTLKAINTKDIHAELVSVYGIDAFVLQTLYK